MDINKNKEEELEEIIDGMQCPKDYACYRSGDERLCRARDIGMESILVCLETNTVACKFSVTFGGLNFCQCPLRVYIAKKLKK